MAAVAGAAGATVETVAIAAIAATAGNDSFLQRRPAGTAASCLPFGGVRYSLARAAAGLARKTICHRRVNGRQLSPQ